MSPLASWILLLSVLVVTVVAILAVLTWYDRRHERGLRAHDCTMRRAHRDRSMHATSRDLARGDAPRRLGTRVWL